MVEDVLETIKTMQDRSSPSRGGIHFGLQI